MHRRSLLAAPFLAAPLAARGQSLFGDKPIRMIVPVAVAGASDIVARIMADAMTPLLGRPIVAPAKREACRTALNLMTAKAASEAAVRTTANVFVLPVNHWSAYKPIASRSIQCCHSGRRMPLNQTRIT